MEIFLGRVGLLTDLLPCLGGAFGVGSDHNEADRHQAEHGQEREHYQQDDAATGRASINGDT